VSRELLQRFAAHANIDLASPPQALTMLPHLQDPGRIADMIAQYLSLTIEQRQQLLEATDVVQRMQMILALMAPDRQAPSGWQVACSTWRIRAHGDHGVRGRGPADRGGGMTSRWQRTRSTLYRSGCGMNIIMSRHEPGRGRFPRRPARALCPGRQLGRRAWR
jgi:hypothetical protein